MNMKKVHAFILALFSASAFANGMPGQSKLLIFEAGGSYSHSYFKSSVTTPESVTPVTPNGFSIDPDDFFPKDFYGGYIGLSFYLPNQGGWLLNTRYDMYGSESKRNADAGTHIEIAPVRLSFTADKVFGCIEQGSFGIGAGAVIENVNKGEADIELSDDNPLGESIHGRTRIDPLVEAFAMYRFAESIGVKLNVAYQIPVNNTFGDGDLNVNLGINYAVPV